MVGETLINIIVQAERNFPNRTKSQTIKEWQKSRASHVLQAIKPFFSSHDKLQSENERLRNQLQVLVNRAGKIPFRFFLEDAKMEHWKHAAIADFFEAYEDARAALSEGGE